MPLLGVDIAWERPTIAQIQATGAHWVARYFSPDASKNLTAAEVHDYPAAGLGIVTVFESTTGRATGGYAAGMADARLAEQQRAAAGLPTTHVHYFAVDQDTSWASVQAYFDGAIAWLGIGRVGCYGGFPVIEGAAAHGIRYLWQTTAWSAGRWSTHATIRQTGATTLSGGADIDQAEVPDFGQFPRPVTPEVDMPITPDDARLIASTLLNTPVPDLALPDGKGGFVQNAFIQLPERAGQRHAQVVDLLSTVLTAVRQDAQNSLDARDAARNAVTALAEVKATLAASGSPVAAQVQAGMDAALRHLGTILDGTTGGAVGG